MFKRYPRFSSRFPLALLVSLLLLGCGGSAEERIKSLLGEVKFEQKIK